MPPASCAPFSTSRPMPPHAQITLSVKRAVTAAATSEIFA
jgi:hypothetical protein